MARFIHLQKRWCQMSSYADRLAALRDQLKRDRLDGFVVPLTDEHMSEYVGSYAQRLAWLTGFQGSAGTAACLEEAAIFVDGRLHHPGPSAGQPDRVELPVGTGNQRFQMGSRRMPNGARIGYDPWLHTAEWVKQATAHRRQGGRTGRGGPKPDRRGVRQAGAEQGALTVQPDEYAGKGSAEKRHEMADWLAKEGADAAVLAALDPIAWTFNIRGADVTHTPVALAFALVMPTARPTCSSKARRSATTSAPISATASGSTSGMSSNPILKSLSGKLVAVDPERSVAAISQGSRPAEPAS